MDDIEFEQRCRFVTARIAVESWNSDLSTQSARENLAREITNVLTPNVAKALPKGWQGVDTRNNALDWIGERSEEGHVFTVRVIKTRELVGLLLINVSADLDKEGLQLRIGYFLSEPHWGQGLGSELIKGLVSWCDDAGDIRELLGLVESNNIASAKVLTRNGFRSFGLPGSEKMLAFRRTI